MDRLLEPFAHVVAHGLWADQLLADVRDEFPPDDSELWGKFDNPRERKFACNDERAFGPSTVTLCQILFSDEMAAELGELFEIPDLSADLTGGGYHQIPRDGLLAMHVDFNRAQSLHRRLNLLVFLNDDYDPSYGGQLLLSDTAQGERKAIDPTFNTTAIFATSETSWHGHPDPWSGPSPRRSFAVYYFSPEPAEDVPEHSTVFAA